jgi:tRNA-2-methylthio-N6-dimethylallyladenosine synthase
MKLHVISYGCQMNLADSEEMARPLKEKGFTPTSELDEADCVLVNTCTVRDHAEHRAVSLLGRLEEWKNDDRLLIVAGCAAERMGRDIQRRFPHVDLVVGAKSIEQFPELVNQALKEKWGDESRLFEGPHPALALEAGAGVGTKSAYVTIMRGCNYTCTYCIVPHVRGRELYRPMDAILAETREKVEAGALEVWFVGQTVNSWRREGRDFADLLREAGKIPGLARIRFMSPHPFFLNERLAEAMAETPAVCAHMHLPAQSGSDRILGLMRRNYTAAGFVEKTRMLRRALPEVALTSDVIVGFPSETEEDFRRSLDLFDEADIDAAYCFKYSPREGTEAADYDGAVPEDIKEERLARLLDRVEKRARAKAARLIGKRVQVLLEDATFGRTEGYFKLRLDAEANMPLVEAEVTGIEGAVLTGRALGGKA